jgi:hypothetical protein
MGSETVASKKLKTNTPSSAAAAATTTSAQLASSSSSCTGNQRSEKVYNPADDTFFDSRGSSASSELGDRVIFFGTMVVLTCSMFNTTFFALTQLCREAN